LLSLFSPSFYFSLAHFANSLLPSFLFSTIAIIAHSLFRNLVFSSSATVYGAPEVMPITEETSVGSGITNAYGRTKYMIEEILRDYRDSAPGK
jgi:UDP-glucose 4-epimerase